MSGGRGATDHQAGLAMEVLRLLDDYRYSSATGERIKHDGTETLRNKVIATLERYFDE